jgi:hypothetical protein
MTLKEKILSDNYLEDYDNPITDYQVDIIVERADDYAIEFAEWLGTNNYKKYSNGWANIFTKATSEKELLKIFKKEKGL